MADSDKCCGRVTMSCMNGLQSCKSVFRTTIRGPAPVPYYGIRLSVRADDGKGGITLLGKSLQQSMHSCDVWCSGYGISASLTAGYLAFGSARFQQIIVSSI